MPHNARMITPAQCRAARAFLDWTQEQLASEAGVGIVTVRQFEGGNAEARRATLTVISAALEKAGVIFLAAGEDVAGGPGVRLRSG